MQITYHQLAMLLEFANHLRAIGKVEEGDDLIEKLVRAYMESSRNAR